MSISPPIEFEQNKLIAVHEDVFGTPHDTTRTIAIAVDNSEFSRFAFQWAIDNIFHFETDQIVILNVRPYAISPYTTLGAMPIMDVGDEYSQVEKNNKFQSHELIRTYAAELMNKKIKCRGVALRGDVKDELVFKVDDIKADMLVIGCRGMGLFKRTFLGSTSDYCMHHCNCPVIVPKMRVEVEKSKKVDTTEEQN